MKNFTKQVDAARLTVECHEDQNVNYCKPLQTINSRYLARNTRTVPFSVAAKQNINLFKI